MTDDLVEWLRVQLDDDEQWARSAMGDTAGEWAEFGQPFPEIVLYDKSGRLTVGHMQHIALHDPARVLRDVEANRLMLDEHYIIERKVNWTDGEGEDRQTHLPVCAVCVPEYSYIGTPDQAVGPCKTVKLLARPHCDRPGYKQEWAA